MTSTIAGGITTLANDFPEFEAINRAATLAPAAVGPAAGDGRATQLQQLQQEMAQAGLLAAGPGLAPQFLEPQFDWGGLFRGAVNVGRTVFNVGRGLGLFADANDFEMQFLGGWLQGQVADLIRKLYGYVNQYSQLADCVPQVTQTVQLFRGGQYVKALSQGYQAYSCIRSKLPQPLAGPARGGSRPLAHPPI